MTHRKPVSTVGILLFLLLLASCTHPPTPALTLWQFRQNCIQELRSQGVQFVQTGETILVGLPSDKVFYPHSANFSPQGERIVGPLGDLLATYQTGIMKISGHTDNACNNEMFNRALSERQARRVADCLVDIGMDARLIYTLGCGSSEPIAANINAAGRAENRRVDIQFRFLSGGNE